MVLILCMCFCWSVPGLLRQTVSLSPSPSAGVVWVISNQGIIRKNMVALDFCEAKNNFSKTYNTL